MSRQRIENTLFPSRFRLAQNIALRTIKAAVARATPLALTI
jgi:hypothetical protein